MSTGDDMDADAVMAQAYAHLCDAAETGAALRAELEERQQRIAIEAAMQPPPVVEASRLDPVVEHEAAALRRLARTAPAATPTPAAMTEAWAGYIQEQLRLFAE